MLRWVVLVFQTADQNVSNDVDGFARLEEIRAEALVEVNESPEKHEGLQEVWDRLLASREIVVDNSLMFLEDTNDSAKNESKVVLAMLRQLAVMTAKTHQFRDKVPERIVVLHVWVRGPGRGWNCVKAAIVESHEEGH